MTSTLTGPPVELIARRVRSGQLADRLMQGARALVEFARPLSDAEWRTAVPSDGRSVGVIVHHVASVYPLEIRLARMVADGSPIVGVTSDTVNEMNAAHAAEFAGVTKETAIELLVENSAAAAEAIRAFTDADLERAAPVSLYADAELTAQFVLEDHAVRHSYHHLAKLRTAVGLQRAFRPAAQARGQAASPGNARNGRQTPAAAREAGVIGGPMISMP